MTTHTRMPAVACLLLSMALLPMSGAFAAGPIDVQFRKAKWDRAIHYVPRVEAGNAPAIDGSLDDEAWKAAFTTSDFFLPGGFEMPHATTLYACWDARNLYLAARCAIDKPDMLRLVGAPGDRDAKSWRGDNVDFHIRNNNTYHFLVAASGATDDLRDGDAKWNPTWSAMTKVHADAYTVEIAIPLAELGVQSQPGSRIIMDFGRQDTSLGGEVVAGLTDSFANMQRAPVFALHDGTDRRQSSSLNAGRSVTSASIITDRLVYPDFVPVATGRVTMDSNQSSELKSGLIIVAALRSGGKALFEHRIENVASQVMDFDLPLGGLPPGEYVLEFRFQDGDEVFKRSEHTFQIEKQSVKTAGEIGLSIPPAPVELDAWGFTFGVPFPWGALASAENVKLIDRQGREVPMDARVTGRWSKKGSVRWLLVDAVLPLRKEPQQFKLVFGRDVSRQPVAQPVTVTHATLADGRAGVVVDAGRLRFGVPKTKTSGISQLILDNAQMATETPGSGPYMVDAAGKRYYGSLDPSPEVVVEAEGPVKVTIRLTGWHVAETGEKLGKYVLHMTAYRGLPWLAVDHTFIITEDTDKVQYRDIGYAFPVRSERGVFGTARVTPFRLDPSGKDPSAYLLQRDYRNSIVSANGQFLDEFGQTEGWVSNAHWSGGTTLSVRDFWQQFPKEIEVTPQHMIAHAWPAHNGTPAHGPENISFQNLHKFWFAHEGELLNFKPPQSLVDLVAKEDPGYAASMAKVNAIGLAKTHDLLLHFHGANWEQARARSVNAAFQFDALVVVDPEWVAASGVFGPMAARDPQRYDAEEQALDGMMQSVFRQAEEDRDYGMFNLGNAHHNWVLTERRWHMHRLWRATHQHWPRWPWIQYARSGNKEVLDYARRNARHVADISHAHYTNAEFAAAGYPRGKIVGGICDYKGLVHWSAGNRLCYNSVGDALLYSYYMTGDHRSLATALEHADALIQDGQAQVGREGSARTASAVALYLHTWDNDLLDFAKRHIDGFENDQLDDGRFGKSSAVTTWSPQFQRYYELTRDPRALQMLRRLHDWVLESPWERLSVMMRGESTRGIVDNLSWLYLQTGEEKYLRAAAWRERLFSKTSYDGDDWRFRGANTADDGLQWSWHLCDAPTYLAALNKHGGRIEPLDLPLRHGVSSFDRETIDGEVWYTLHARIRQQTDVPFTIEISEALRGRVLDLRAIDGDTAITVEAKVTEDGRSERLFLEVPSDLSLEYAVRLRARKDFWLDLPLVRTPTDTKEVYAFGMGGGLHVYGGPQYWLDLPEGAQRFVSLYQGDSFITTVRVTDGSGNVVHDNTFNGANGGGSFNLPVTGGVKGWSFQIVGNHGRGRGTILRPTVQPDKPQLWFSIAPEKCFTPAPLPSPLQ